MVVTTNRYTVLAENGGFVYYDRADRIFNNVIRSNTFERAGNMLFNSLSYAIFLPIVFIIYWVIPHKARWILLLAASYYFYMSWNPAYVVLILFTTIVSYACGLILEKEERVIIKKVTVAVSLLLCLGVLFLFKYYNFFVYSLSLIAAFEPRYTDFLLPVGISFYTFQTLSYVIDVYKGTIKAEKNLGIYAAFVSFFPQLVAGPIERSVNLLPQLKEKHEFNVDNTYYGIRLIIWGLYKKMLIADNLAVYVDKVFNNIYSSSGGSIMIATVFFSIQIYCDFSGYSDIARGSAKLFGIDLMENFKSPYFSTSVKDFWSRWHISLSSWFKDYLYIPLGGNRVSKFRNALNVLITFLISGLWHGANWTFVVWGGLHGIAQVYENAFGIKKSEDKGFFTFIRRVVVFVFVTYAWLFFRVETIRQGFFATSAIIDGLSNPINYMSTAFKELEIDVSFLPYFILYFIPLFIFDYFSLKTDVISIMGQKNALLRNAIIIIIIALIMLFGYVGQSTFVYFQF